MILGVFRIRFDAQHSLRGCVVFFCIAWYDKGKSENTFMEE